MCNTAAHQFSLHFDVMKISHNGPDPKCKMRLKSITISAAVKGVVLVNGKKINFNYRLTVSGKKHSRLLVFNIHTMLPYHSLSLRKLCPVNWSVSMVTQR